MRAVHQTDDGYTGPTAATASSHGIYECTQNLLLVLSLSLALAEASIHLPGHTREKHVPVFPH